MSVWDVVGAVMSMLTLVLSTTVWVVEALDMSAPTRAGAHCFFLSLASLGWFTFCVARLLGAHL